MTNVEEYIKFEITFGAGIYAGIYLSQNYQVPRVDEPKEMWKRLKDIADQYKKPPEL